MYNYLRSKAINGNDLDKENLAIYLSTYQPKSFNGEYFDIGGGLCMMPANYNYEIRKREKDMTVYNYEIFKTPISTPYKFRDYTSKVDTRDYVRVYSGSLVSEGGDFEVLEFIFQTFNTNIPKDYHSSSLSVSDIIKLNGRFYYVEGFGFKEI